MSSDPRRARLKAYGSQSTLLGATVTIDPGLYPLGKTNERRVKGKSGVPTAGFKVGLKPNAALYRSDALRPGGFNRYRDEVIAEGSPERLAAIALSDPDNEIWRYSIWAKPKWYHGEQIRVLQKGSKKLK